MFSLSATTASSPPARRRAGFGLRSFLLALPLLVAVGAAAWYFRPSFSWSSEDSGPLTYRVERSDFVHDITERGNIESASNVEIRCEVQSRGSQGTMILEVVPEGTYVQTGDQLCRLDSSSLENEQTQQQIICNSSEAAVIQAQSNYDTAVIAKQEYLEGIYAEKKQELEGKIFVTEETLRRAEQSLEYTKKLFARGYVTELAVEADQFAVENAKKELEQNKTALHVLKTYTKPKMVMQLEADIKTTAAKLKSEEHSHKLDMEKLEEVETQIEKCKIVAPQPGQVVYANVTDRRGGQEIVIEEGTLVRERQVIFRLPDPKRMQVKAKINEASIAMVEEGMAVSIRLDAFPEQELKGEVEKVNEYPAPTSWFNSNIKEYETTIKVFMPKGGQEKGDTGEGEEKNSPPGVDLRPGMTAEVKIRVETIPHVLQVPVQAVVEHGGKNYCLSFDEENGWSKKPVSIGSTNDKMVVILDGLKEGDAVVLGANKYRDQVGWPKEPAKPKVPAKPRQEEKKATGGPGARRPNPAQAFQRMDADGNGKLSGEEIPAPLRSRLSSVDTNGDGAIDRQEFAAVAAKMRGRRPGGRPPGAGAPGGGPRPGGKR